jgi:two-component system, NarL family, invasion response regulator UvrY
MNGAKPIKILLVDDHAIVREGYRSLLQKQPGMRVVAEAADSAEAYQKFKECNPDVVIMDLSLPGQSGFETIAKIKQRCAEAKILVFSMHQNPGFVQQAIRAGALGYVTKSSLPEILLHAIYEVYAGRPILSPDIAQTLALENLGVERIAMETLTTREFEILRMLVAAKSTGQIAQTLNISPKTVANCHYQIKHKLGVSSDIELAQFAIKMQLINL